MKHKYISGQKFAKGRFEIVRSLGARGSARVYEAYDLQQPTPRARVAIKFLSSYNGDTDKARNLDEFFQECAIWEKIHHPGLIKILFSGREEEPYLVAEYLDGGTLAERFIHKPATAGDSHCEPVEIVKIAKNLTETLAVVHSHGIIHGEIQPSNIGFRSQTDESPVLFDFGHTHFLSLEDEQSRAQTISALPYMPPERIGFLTKQPTAASDLYSLGLTLYEMATGSPLFVEQTPAEIYRKILSVVPPSLDRVIANFPGPLAEIIDKLIRKQPDDRYQSAGGLLHDLKRVDADLRSGNSPYFALGCSDSKRELNYHVPMIGRDHDLQLLRTLLHKTTADSKDFAMIGAPSGVGKTRLAREFLTLAEADGFAIFRAKFTEFEQNVPLSAVEKSMAYAEQTLSKLSADELAAWHVTLQETLQSRGGLLCKKFPYLKPYLPVFPDFQSLDPEAEEAVFLETFVDFLPLLYWPRKVVIFLDDLQWADHISIKLIKAFAKRAQGSGIGNGFFLGSYRSDEGVQINNEILPLLFHYQYVALVNLSKADTMELTQQLLDQQGDQILRLQELTYELSQGNVFFIYEFLNAALKNGLFTMDAGGTWKVDEQVVLKSEFSKSVTDLISTRIQKLSSEANEVLCTASIVGNTVPLSFLSELLTRRRERHETRVGKDSFVLERAIHELVNHHLVWPADQNLVFFHDRIRSSSYKTIDPVERRHIHTDYANILAAFYGDKIGRTEAKILFELAFHVQSGDHEGDVEKSRNILKLAGERALELFAYQRAKGYLKECSALYPCNQDAMREQGLFDSYLSIQESLGDALALSEEIKQAIIIYEFLNSCVTHAEKRAAIYLKLSQNYFYLFRYYDSVTAARRGLEALGKKFLVSEFTSICLVVVLLPYFLCYLAWFKLFGKQTHEVQSSREDLLWRLRIGLQQPSFFSKPLTAWVMHLISTIRLLKYKDNPYRASVLMHWGIVLASIGIDKLSRRCYQASLDYFEKNYDPINYSFGIFTRAYLLDFIQGRVEAAEAKIVDSLRITTSIGESFTRMISYQALAHLEYYGINTNKAEEAIKQLEKMWRHSAFVPTVMSCRLRHEICTDQLDTAQKWIKIVCEGKRVIAAQGFPSTIDTIYADLGPGEAYLLLDQPQLALPLLKSAVWAILIHVQRISYCNYAPILLSQAYSRAGHPFKALVALLAVIPNVIFSVKIFKPQTFFALGEAFYRLRWQRLGKACLEHGINVAKKGGFVPVVAEGQLLFGTYLSTTDPEYAEDLLLRARKYFESVRYHYLAARCEKYLALSMKKKRLMYPKMLVTNDNTTATSALRSHVEASTLLEMFTKLSVLTDIGTLLKTALDAACGISGADHGVIFVKEGDSWIPREGKNVDRFNNSLSSMGRDIDVKFIERALASDLSKAKSIVKQGEIDLSFFKSVMVLPLEYKAELYGAIYLGNRNITGLFDARTVEFLVPLATQIAVAIQNFSLLEKTHKAQQEVIDLHKSANQRLSAEVLRQTEELYQVNIKLLEQNEQRTRFFQNISHELRTPLTLILNTLQKVSKIYPQDSELTVAHNNTKRLYRLVNQLLDLQRLEATSKELKLSAIDLANFIRICADYFGSATAAKDIRFSTTINGKQLGEVQSSERVIIKGEIDALEKIVFNFLSNAMKYSPAHGAIEFGLIVKKDRVRIFVADNGKGISPQDQHKLFKVFSQVDNSSTREYEGTGLGLALAKELTVKMSGEIGVDSQVGTGACFWVEFPLLEVLNGMATVEQENRLASFKVKDWLLEQSDNHVPSDSADAVVDSTEDGSKELILVIDDLRDMRELIRKTLLQQGFRAKLAVDGVDGLAKAKLHKPNLIIVDWMMPRMSGPEFIKNLHAIPELATVPVVLLTAKADEASKLSGLAVGADAFLSKPFDDLELVSIVNNMLRLKSSEQKIADSLEDKNVLVAMITHDIANPLSVTTNAMELLELNFLAGPDADNQEVSKFIDKIKRSNDSIAAIISQVRLLESIENKRVLEFNPVRMGEAFDEALFIVQEKIVAKQIVIEKSIEDVAVLSDKSALVHSVLSNLLTNAIKFSAAQGKITCLARSIDSSQVLIEICDEGSGIPQELQAVLFSLGHATSRRGTAGEIGTGFGLPIAKKLVNKMGGQISVSSPYQLDSGAWCSGAKFSVTIPKAARCEKVAA